MKDQLQKGIKIEKEHKPTYDWLVAELKKTGKIPPAQELYKKIAEDHLAEHEKYYIFLEAMEELLEEIK